MGSDKIWVIDPTKLKKRFRDNSPWNGGSTPPGTGAAEPFDDPIADGMAPPVGAAGTGTGKEATTTRRRRNALLVLLACLAGPFASLVTREGRRSRFWTILTVLSTTGAAIAVWRWNSIFAPGDDLRSLPWAALAGLALLGIFVSWSRAVLLVGRHEKRLAQRLPKWARHPASAGLLGFVSPGLGLLVSGHHRRAACALWTAGVPLISALLLSQAMVLWRLRAEAGSGIFSGAFLERLFITAAVAGSIGIAGWFVQALDGARLAGGNRSGNGKGRSDTAAAALLVAIAAFALLFDAGYAARGLDRFAGSAQHHGFRIIPLYTSRAAIRLDPSEPAYVLRAAELREDLGDSMGAREMRTALAERWMRSSEDLMRRGLLGGRIAAAASPVERARSAEDILADPLSRPSAEGDDQARADGGSWIRLDLLYGSGRPPDYIDIR